MKVSSARVLPEGPLLAGAADVRVSKWFLVRWIVDVIASRRSADPWRMILVYGIILPLVGSLAYAQGTYMYDVITIHVDSPILKMAQIESVEAEIGLKTLVVQ